MVEENYRQLKVVIKLKTNIKQWSREKARRRGGHMTCHPRPSHHRRLRFVLSQQSVSTPNKVEEESQALPKHQHE
jgi:hypothetical protein